ncbi:adhesion G protein-coupled receptor F5 [Emydura macquarii macquarii]|uniref:adhesion G protein-coupled receptor F5 n=1 Tax=Emydura macquarii macquarii TaxID=1129001 RepID=UPI00352B09D0
MPSLGIMAICFLSLIVTTSSHALLDFNFDPFIHYSPDRGNGTEENIPTELHRQKRQVAAPGLAPVEYTVDIEISFPDSSLLESIKDYLKNLSFPVPIKTADAAMTISSINVTTVCRLTSNYETHCSCESGYGWPAAVCTAHATCPDTILTPEKTCDCIRQLPSQGPYCQPGDIPTKSITINVSVRLNVTFQDDLRNPSSELYKRYKTDLEHAFTQSYKSLPGFISATVTGFRAGSVVVDYDVKATPATLTQIENASANIPPLIDKSYQLDSGSFMYAIERPDQTNFSVSPEDIFEGDTVTMNCETSLDIGDVHWYHSGQVILNSRRHSMSSITIEGMTKSELKITNVTQDDTGAYTCTFMNSSLHKKWSFKATHNITVAPINIVQSGDIEVVCDNSEVLLSCCIDGNIQSFTINWRPDGAINIPGATSFTTNCTEYTLQAKPSQCPGDKSGTETTYTCELSTKNGALGSKAIKVTYLAVANVTISSSTKPLVSEGHNFSLTCISDMSNYDKVTWQIQAGASTKTIDPELYVRNWKSPTGATSLLTVRAANEEWNGTYTCTFFQKSLQSSATITVEIVPLPLKQNIIVDPIEAFIQCNVPQVLRCCIFKMETYIVTFTVQQKDFKTEKKTQGNQTCYEYNYTDSCSSRTDVVTYCNIVNQVQDTVTSSPMRLRIASGNIMCSDIIGVGEAGAQIIKRCPIRGNLTYVCVNKNWIVARNSCLSDGINTLLNKAELLVLGPQPAEKVAQYLETLQNDTANKQQEINNSSANLGAIITIMDLVSTIPLEAKPSTMRNFLSTVDIIVSNSTRGAWKELNNQEPNRSSLLLDSVERFSRSLQPVSNTIPSITTTNLQLQGIVITENSVLYYNKSFTFSSSANLSGNVLINGTKIQSLELNSTIISVAFSTLKDILPQPNGTNETVNGLVMTTTVSGNLTEDFQISLTFAKSNSSLKEPQCVFWNFSLFDGAEGWDDTGCQPKDEGDNVICTCDHLTSFSILMSPNMEPTVPGDPPGPLDYITYIGVSISIVSLGFCILIESLVWKSVTKNRTSYMRHVCILNIAVSLLLADIWFIIAASIHDTKEPVNGNICIAATFFIHLFYLCVFFWMLAMGLMIFYRLVFILHVSSKTIQKTVAFSLGYGCPLLISVITIAVTQPRDVYRRENACWLNWEKSKALLAFVIPALLIVAVNSIIAVVVIVKILRPAIGDKPNKQEKSSLIQVLKSVSILTPLLGLTWGFGLATIIEDSSIVFHILFTLLNAFQGLFILVFGTLWDKKVREALLNKYSFARWSSQQTKSATLGVSAPTFSMGSPFSRTLNNFFGKAGKYKISSPETTCSTIEHTSNTYSLLH